MDPCFFPSYATGTQSTLLIMSSLSMLKRMGLSSISSGLKPAEPFTVVPS